MSHKETVQRETPWPSLWRNNSSVTKASQYCPGDPKCRGRKEMEESYETFEEELWPSRTDPPPQKPVRQIRKPEMYTTRKNREEMAPAPQQPTAEPKTLPREVSLPKPTSSHKTLSTQNLAQTETPWENVTLNRCLFVAITILVLTSGFQRLHETLRGQRAAQEVEEVGLTMRRSGSLRHRGPPPEPETSLWEVMFWWLPDFDLEEEEDDGEDDGEEDGEEDGEAKSRKLKRGATARGLRGLRNKPLPDKKLMKQRHGKLKDRRAKKGRDEELKAKKERAKTDDPEDAGDDDTDGDKEAVAKENKKLEEKKEKHQNV